MRISGILTVLAAVLIFASGPAWAASRADEDRAAALLPDSLLQNIGTDGPGIPIIVFNPLSWTRTDAVEMESPYPGEGPHVTITDERGRVSPARCLGDRLYFTARDVPAIGYKVFWANRVSKPAPASVKATDELLENQFFRVRIDKFAGVVTSIYDKLNSRYLMTPGGSSALLQVVPAKGGRPHDLRGDGMAVMMDSGPARGMVILDHGYDKSPFVQEVALHDGVPRLDIRLTSDWRQPRGSDGSTLRVAFATDVRSRKATVGWIERSPDSPKVPAMRWVDCSSRSYGASLLVDQAMDVTASNGVLMATLLKPKAGPQADASEVRYALYAHRGDWRAGGVFRRAFEIKEPLVARLAGKHTGAMPRSASLVSVNGVDVIAVAMKQDAADGSLMLKFHETGGTGRATAARIHAPYRTAVEMDTAGNRVGVAGQIAGGKFAFKLARYDVRTFLFTRSPGFAPVSAAK